MYQPSFYIVDNQGNPVSGLKLKDIGIKWIDLYTNDTKTLPALTMVEDPDIPALYRISGFQEVEVGEYSEIIISYLSKLVKTFIRKLNKTFGPYLVELAFKDLNSNKLSGVVVSIRDKNSGAVMLDSLVSDSLGKILFGCGQGEYKIICNRPRTIFEPYYSLVVNSDTSLEITGSVAEIPVPNTRQAVVYGYIYDVAGNPLEKVEIQYGVVPPLPKQTGNVLVYGYSQSVFTDSDGYFEMTLLSDIKIEIRIPKIGLSKTVVLPSSGVFNITEL